MSFTHFDLAQLAFTHSVSTRPDWVLLAGIAVAAAAWAFMFAPSRDRFWSRAPVAGVAVAVYALVAQRHRLDVLLRVRPVDVGLGIASGLVLYAIFFVGNKLLDLLFPRLAMQVEDLYALQQETLPKTIPYVLCLMGPAEELMFRGLVQQRAGIAAMIVVYALVHVWERKLILILAAVAGGIWWGATFAVSDGSLVAAMISHLVWGQLIIVLFPVRGGRPGRRRVTPTSTTPEAG